MNRTIRTLIGRHDLSTRMDEWRERLRETQYNDVLGHLVGFTGLDEDEVVFRCMRKLRGFGARGWFHDEWEWAAPDSPREIDWYYRAAQCYLFSNARRAPWGEVIEDVGSHGGPVLEFGCGIGHNLKPLLEAGVGRVAFYDHSHVQHAFCAYRARQWGFTVECHPAAEPGLGWPDQIKPNTYNTIILQDVLEHMPDYEPKLKVLLLALRSGGVVYERSPFTHPTNERVKKNKPMHMTATKPLGKVMKANGMKLLRKGDEGLHVWEKKVGKK